MAKYKNLWVTIIVPETSYVIFYCFGIAYTCTPLDSEHSWVKSSRRDISSESRNFRTGGVPAYGRSFKIVLKLMPLHTDLMFLY